MYKTTCPTTKMTRVPTTVLPWWLVLVMVRSSSDRHADPAGLVLVWPIDEIAIFYGSCQPDSNRPASFTFPEGL